LLVGYFDYKTAKEFLKECGPNKDEIEWKYFSGKPVYLVEGFLQRDAKREDRANEDLPRQVEDFEDVR